MKFIVSHQGQALAPATIDEIVGKVRAKEVDLFDYVYDEQKDDWILLMEFPLLAERLKSNKPPRPPKASDSPLEAVANLEAVRAEAAPATVVPAAAAASTAAAAAAAKDAAIEAVSPAPAVSVVSAHAISEWYVLKGDNRFGPFVYTDLVKMLQQKVVFPFDFIWHAGLDKWKRVVELDDFTAEAIRKFFEKSTKTTDVFMERKFARKSYTGRVIVHDNLSLWKGDGFEISRGGVGINMSNTLVVPGQHVFVHFKRHENWPAFNAVCEVVSKKFVNDASPVQYGLRFLSLSQEAQEEFYQKVA